MDPKTISTIVDLGLFFVLIIIFDWGFIPALIVSVLAGMVVHKVLSR
jgi:hypothetical protein